MAATPIHRLRSRSSSTGSASRRRCHRNSRMPTKYAPTSNSVCQASGCAVRMSASLVLVGGVLVAAGAKFAVESAEQLLEQAREFSALRLAQFFILAGQ